VEGRLIHASDVDEREPRPDGQNLAQDEALPLRSDGRGVGGDGTVDAGRCSHRATSAV
jgi:hypothetical protein